jgi:hypothetical protein
MAIVAAAPAGATGRDGTMTRVRLLEQQQLIDPDPVRRLIVRPGHYSW